MIIKRESPLIPETSDEEALYDACMLVLEGTPLRSRKEDKLIIDSRAENYMTIPEPGTGSSRRPKC